MPAGRGNICEPCYWKSTFLKRLQLDEAGLSSPQFSSLFRLFGTWLIGHVPPQKAALTIHKYFPFFREIEEQWGQMPSYAQLLRHFTAEGLRRVRIPMGWLTETGQVAISVQEREDASDKRRIDTILAVLPAGTAASAALVAYKDELEKKAVAARTSVRSLRLALRPAASLLLSADAGGQVLPTQNALDRYLVSAPGQKAAVTGFISFLNRNHGSALVLRIDRQLQRSLRQRALELELTGLLARETRDDLFRDAWIMVSLQYFHGLSRRVATALAAGIVLVDAHGFSVEREEANYWVPHWDHRPGAFAAAEDQVG